MERRRVETWIYRLVLLAALLQGLLVLTSWLWGAALPDSQVRSLLSSGGIRWFFGSFVVNVASPLLVWLIVGAMAVSAVRESGLWRALKHRSLTARQLFALRSSLVLAILEVVVLALLTVLPHAILLSVTGELFPSSFSVSLVPVISFVAASAAVFYGLSSGKLHSLHDVGHCLCAGGANLMPLLLLYVVSVQLFWSIVYVFG